MLCQRHADNAQKAALHVCVHLSQTDSNQKHECGGSALA